MAEQRFRAYGVGTAHVTRQLGMRDDPGHWGLALLLVPVMVNRSGQQKVWVLRMS